MKLLIIKNILFSIQSRKKLRFKIKYLHYIKYKIKHNFYTKSLSTKPGAEYDNIILFFKIFNKM